MIPELETLDPLLGGPLPLRVIRARFPDDHSLAKCVLNLLDCGDLLLEMRNGQQVPKWEWEMILGDTSDDTWPDLQLILSRQGGRKISQSRRLARGWPKISLEEHAYSPASERYGTQTLLLVRAEPQ